MTDEVVDVDTTLGGERVEFRPEHEVLAPRCAIDEREFSAAGRQVLQHRPERGDPDAPGDERDPAACPAGGGQHAVGALEIDPCTDRRVGQSARVVAQVLDGEPEPRSVRGSGHREGMPAPPCVASEEPHDEVLPGSSRQPVEVAAGQVQRDDTRRFGHYVRDPEPMPE